MPHLKLHRNLSSLHPLHGEINRAVHHQVEIIKVSEVNYKLLAKKYQRIE